MYKEEFGIVLYIGLGYGVGNDIFFGKETEEKRFNGCSRPGNGLRRIVYLVIKHNGKDKKKGT